MLHNATIYKWLIKNDGWPKGCKRMQNGTACWLIYQYQYQCQLKGCRPCRRPLTEETAKFDADDEHEDKQWKHGPISNIIWQTCWDDFRDTERKWHVNRQSHKKFKAFAVCLKNQILHLAVCFYSGLGIHLQKPQQQQGSCPRHAKHEPQKLFHVTFRIHKKQCMFWASRNLALEHRFRKPRTAKHKR